jgi:hypothetical protein
MLESSFFINVKKQNYQINFQAELCARLSSHVAIISNYYDVSFLFVASLQLLYSAPQLLNRISLAPTLR